MPNVLIRDVPDDVHAVLRRRAAERHLSLQQYLVAELRRLTQQPSLGEVLDRIERRTGGRVGFEQAVRDLEAARNERDQR